MFIPPDAKPLPMSAEMVIPTMALSKTGTRRTKGLDRFNLSPNDYRYDGANEDGTFNLNYYLKDKIYQHNRVVCPFGGIGTVFYVREAWRTLKSLDGKNGTEIAEACLDAGYRTPWAPVQYEADRARERWPSAGDGDEVGRYRSGRFMPRFVARTLLKVTSIRLERLGHITDIDARSEGLRTIIPDVFTPEHDEVMYYDYQRKMYLWRSPRGSFFSLWDSINGQGAHLKNPWVWVIGFERYYAQDTT